MLPYCVIKSLSCGGMGDKNAEFVLLFWKICVTITETNCRVGGVTPDLEMKSMTKKENKSSPASNNRSTRKRWMLVGAVAIIVLLAAAVWWFATRGDTQPETPVNTNATEQTQATGDHQDNSEQTQPSENTQPSGETQSSGQTQPSGTGDDEDEYFTFAEGISISSIYKYAGMFMEDGTNEVVQDVMMLIVRNDTAQDLQLARFEVDYSDYTAQFEVTNLPAGQSVVALEQNRRAYSDDSYQDVKIKDVVFFAEPMSLCENQVKLTGGEGYIDVENISEDTLGLVYIYYKNSAKDILYGGITYRVKLDTGLEPGEITRVTTGHYSPENSTILLVQIAENVTE